MLGSKFPNSKILDLEAVTLRGIDNKLELICFFIINYPYLSFWLELLNSQLKIIHISQVKL